MKIRNLSLKLTTLGVIAAIVTLSVFQYRWAVSSGEKSIKELVQSYNIRIYAVLTQELSQIELFDHRPTENSHSSIETLQQDNLQMVEQFIDTYGDGYIKGISYYSDKEDNGYFIYDGNQWIVNQVNQPDIADISKSIDFLEMRDLRISRDPQNESLINIMRFYPQEEVIFHYKLNFHRFMEEELIPVMSQSFGELSLSWQNQPPEMGIDADDRHYKFSPVKSLLSLITGNDREYFISIPYSRVPLMRFTREMPFKFFNNSKEDLLYITITTPQGESVISDRENGIAIQWLTGLFLLFGIGIAYGLILYQKTRLSRLRTREKEFVATVTHELRTPLTVIHSAADNIQSGILTQERLLQYGDLIKDQSIRLSSMIEGILLFSRIEGKAEQPPPQNPLAIQDLVENLEIFIQSLNDSTKNIKIDFASLPDQIVSDRETIELVLTNLINNCIRHGYGKNEEGQIRVSGHIKLPNSLVFSVEDDGFGVPHKEKKQIFEPFFRGSRSLSEQVKGSGLGLYLIKRKLKLMGGSITIESPYLRPDGKMRNGSRFVVNIPQVETKK